MRHHSNWLDAFCQLADVGEAPHRIHWWVGVFTLAATLRRRIWREEYRFRWYPNFYLLLVAKPGVIAKSTTADLSEDLLLRIPGMHKGPSSITWQAIPGELAKSIETYQLPDGTWRESGEIFFNARELGNFLDLRERALVNFLIEMWDNTNKYDKMTKHSGNDSIPFPCVNIIAGTTPSWLAENCTENTVGGGLFSRMTCIYAEKKEKFVPFPSQEIVPADYENLKLSLAADLERISTLSGPVELSKEALAWARDWYIKLWSDEIHKMPDDRLQTHMARRQTQMVKLAMVIAVSKRDRLVVTREDMEQANQALIEVDADVLTIMSSFGKTAISSHVDRLIKFVHAHGTVEMSRAHRHMHAQFPHLSEFEDIVKGAVQAGFMEAPKFTGEGFVLIAKKP